MTEPANRTQPFTAQHLAQLHDSNVVYSSDPTTILGAGGFGVVHKAIDSVTQEVLAVKRVQHAADPPSGSNNSKEPTKDKLDREHKALRALPAHRNIVTIHSVETKPMETLIVMEYLADGNLKKLINEEGPFSAGRIAQIAVQICNGLNVLHNVSVTYTNFDGTKAEQIKSIIHCDLKPENILVDLKRNTFKICDFGLAHTTQSSVTYQTSVCGTWNYMAPEQFHIGAKLTVKTDIYGLGALMWHMATKTAPWGELHMSEICKRMTAKEAGVENRLSLVSNVIPGFDADLAKLIYDCTNPLAADRPTLQDVTKLLQQVLQANPMSPANFNVSAGYDTDNLPVVRSNRTYSAHVGEDGITSLKLLPKNDE